LNSKELFLKKLTIQKDIVFRWFLTKDFKNFVKNKLSANINYLID